MLQKAGRMGLWIALIVILVAIVVQGWSGNWTVFFAIWPVKTATYSQTFMSVVGDLTAYHLKMGWGIGIIGILVLILAFLGRANLLVKLLAIAGVALAAVAALGGYHYVHSIFQDQMALGQMADSFLGITVVYFAMLFFLGWGKLFKKRA